METGHDDLVRRLKEVHARIVCTQRNSSGAIVHLIQFDSGEMTAMFHADALRLAHGTETLRAIVARNADADLAGPWPALAQAPEMGRCPECQAEGTLRRWSGLAGGATGTSEATLDVIVCMVCDYATYDEHAPRWSDGVTPSRTRLRRPG